MGTREGRQLRLRWVCFALLLMAAVFRLLDHKVPWAQPHEEAQAAAAPIQSFEKKEYPTVLYRLPPCNTLEFTPGDADYAPVDNHCGAEFSPAALIEKKVLSPVQEGPVVLIVHTHATEAYTMTADTVYKETTAYRTEDTDYNVVRVGSALADCLNAYGIETLHDKTLNDLPGYNDSYQRMGKIIEGYLAEYPSIQLVIDLHRDAVSDGNGGELALRAQVEGKTGAQLLFVMGTDLGGIPHEAWQENLALAMQLQALSEKAAPGIFRDICLRASPYNQQLAPHGLLLEVGTSGNTLQEALVSVEFFGRQLARLLQGTEG